MSQEEQVEQTSQSEQAGEFQLQWHMTDRCNLHCRHCYQDNYSNRSDMSLGELIALADMLVQTLSKWRKTADISITGGEPFARRDVFSFLAHLDSCKEVSDFHVLSNGTLITEELVNKLEKFKRLKSIQISLDGASPEIHDYIRGNGAYEKAMTGIRILRRHGLDVKIMFTLQRCNMMEIPELIDLCIKEGISSLTIERLVPMGSARTAKDSLLSHEELRKIFQYASDRSDFEYQKGTQLRLLKYRPLWINIDPCRAAPEANTVPHKELGAACSIGLDGICILPDATVLACRRLPIPIGNLKTDSLERIWFQSDLLWQIRDKNNLRGKCNSCEFIPRCGGCRSMAFACSGDYLAEDPQCWK